MDNIFLDTEFDPASGKLLQISLYNENRNQLFSSYINPQCKINETLPHKLKRSFLENYPTFGQLSQQIKHFIDRSTLIAHYGFSSDFRLLKKEFDFVGDTFNCDLIDTRYLVAPGLPKKLSSIYELFFDSALQNSHDATADVMALYKIVLFLRDFSSNQNSFKIQTKNMENCDFLSLHQEIQISESLYSLYFADYHGEQEYIHHELERLGFITNNQFTQIERLLNETFLTIKKVLKVSGEGKHIHIQVECPEPEVFKVISKILHERKSKIITNQMLKLSLSNPLLKLPRSEKRICIHKNHSAPE